MYSRASASISASMSAPHGNPQTSPAAKAAASTFVWRRFACTIQLPMPMTTAPRASNIGRSSAKNTTTWPRSPRARTRKAAFPNSPYTVLSRDVLPAHSGPVRPKCKCGRRRSPRLPSDRDAAHRAKARDPAAGRRGARRDGPAGRLEGARRALGPRRLVVDGPRRARRARGARPADASAHLGGARPDGERLPGVRRGARRGARRAAGRARRRPRAPCANEIEQALRATTEMLSDATRLLALVSAPSLETASIRHVEVLRLQPRAVMVVVITSTGRRDEADVRARGAGRSRPRRVGSRVPRGTARRRAARIERGAPPARGSGARAARARVPRAHRPDAPRGRRQAAARDLRRRSRRPGRGSAGRGGRGDDAAARAPRAPRGRARARARRRSSRTVRSSTSGPSSAGAELHAVSLVGATYGIRRRRSAPSA